MELSELDLNRTYTYADYLLWRFQERVELIKGRVLKMSPAPSTKHQEISGNLYLYIRNGFATSPCKVFSAPFDVRLTRKHKKKDIDITTVVQPDLCVVCDLTKLDARGCLGAPDLVIEVLSPGNTNREMKDKFEVYQESGVKEYWLVNPVDENVIIYLRNEEGIFIGLAPYIAEDTLRSPTFPSLEIVLARVFE